MGRLLVRPEFCYNCRNCEMVCSINKLGYVSPAEARIRVKGEERTGISRIAVCTLGCGKTKVTVCMEACPEEAIEWSVRLGIPVIDGDKCIGCGSCVEACPTGSIFIDPKTGQALKCDLCDGSPMCVQFCRNLWHLEGKALSYDPSENDASGGDSVA